MKVRPVFTATIVAVAVGSLFYSAATDSGTTNTKIAEQQVPGWSKEDLKFFLHGSMSTEVVPAAVLRAVINTYPALFPSSDLSHLRLISDPAFTCPIGSSRTS